ncbi:MAG: T9SS type A sorting domain-containing protein [Cyclobacteriaceae bacterium]
MKILYSFIVLTFSALTALAQFETIDDDATKVRTWEAASSWRTDGGFVGQPGGTLPNVDADSESITIAGYVTRTGNLTFLNDGNDAGQNFTVEDTLIVFGDVDFENNSLDLVVNGVMIVFGQMLIKNQIDVGNGGTLYVRDDLTFSGGQGDYSNTGTGKLYVDGTLSGDGAPPSSEDLDLSTLDDNGDNDDQELFNFISDGGGNGVLPVELLFFSGFADNAQSVNLSWATATEENFEYFEISHSINGKEFEVIGTVAGNGNTTTRHDYAYQDPAPYSGLNYYRLKSVDYDGYTEIFPLVAVQVNQQLRPQVFPNPSDGLQLNFKGLDALNPFDIEILSLDGKQHSLQQGVMSNSVLLSPSLSQGIYIVNTTVGNQTFSQRLIVK